MPRTRPSHVCSQTKSFLHESHTRPTEDDLKAQLPPKTTHPRTSTSGKTISQRPTRVCSQTKYQNHWSMAPKKLAGAVLKREGQGKKLSRSMRPVHVCSATKSHLRDDNTLPAQSESPPPMYPIHNTLACLSSEKKPHVVVELPVSNDPPSSTNVRFSEKKAMDGLPLYNDSTETPLVAPHFSTFAVRSVKKVLLVACTVGLVYLNMK